MFYGLNPAARSARFMGDGNFKFSATTVATVGKAVSQVLYKPQETANRSVFISSFEVSLNELLTAYKKATGNEDWTVTHADIDEEIKAAQESLGGPKGSSNMMAVAKLGMAVELKDEFGSNFDKLGILDNDLLGLSRESVDDTVAAVLKVGLKP